MSGGGCRISVLIPVFNRRELVGDAIRSALSEDLPGLEVVVIDNHSDDGTWEYLQSLNDPRLRVLRNESNLGIFGNFDRCAAQARGEFALFLCSDDRLRSGFLAAALEQLQGAPDAVLLSSRGRQIDEHGVEQRLIADRFAAGRYDGRSVVPAWFWTSYNYGANPLNYPSGIVFRTDILKAELPFRTRFGAVADVDMFLRVLRHGDLQVCDHVGCYVMRHSLQEGLAARRTGELMRKDVALLEEYRPELERFGAYRAVERQMACLVLACLVRMMRVSPRQAVLLFRELGRSPMQMAHAASRRLWFKLIDRVFGRRIVPYLKAK